MLPNWGKQMLITAVTSDELCTNNGAAFFGKSILKFVAPDRIGERETILQGRQFVNIKF